jgi:predicted MFS family arabinose efflux permease
VIFTLVKAPDGGWAAGRTIGGLAVAAVLMAAFGVNEQRRAHPLLPSSIFRIKGLAAADATQVIAWAGFYSMFFFVTLYMQNVLGYSPLRTGVAYLPVTVGIGVGSTLATKMFVRTGTRPIIVFGALLAAGGILWLSRLPVDGAISPTCSARSWSRQPGWGCCMPVCKRLRTQACRRIRPDWLRP